MGKTRRQWIDNRTRKGSTQCNQATEMQPTNRKLGTNEGFQLAEVGECFPTEATSYLKSWPEHVSDGVVTIQMKETFTSKNDGTVDLIGEVALEAARDGHVVFVSVCALDPYDHMGFLSRLCLERFNSYALDELNQVDRPHEFGYTTPYEVFLGPAFFGPPSEELFENARELTENQADFLTQLVELHGRLYQRQNISGFRVSFARQTSPLLRISDGPILEGRYPLRDGSGVTSAIRLWPGSDRYEDCAKELAKACNGEGSPRTFEFFMADFGSEWLEQRMEILRVWFSPDEAYVSRRRVIEQVLRQALLPGDGSNEYWARISRECPWAMP